MRALRAVDKDAARHKKAFRQYRTNEVVDARVNFSQDSLAETKGLLGVNRGFCKMKIAKKASRSVPLNCAALPLLKKNIDNRS